MTVDRQDVTDLLARLRTELGRQERTAHLVERVPEDDGSPMRIALVGPFNTGKTMLVAALKELPLEDVEALTAAIPKTAGVTPYDWRGHVLLDLPGTLAALDAHDHEARRGIRQADLLLIVTTVELPGQDEAEHIQHLLDEDGFRGRALVVVNKINTEQSEAAVIEREIKRRLGRDNRDVPVVFTDARDLVDALTWPKLPDEDRLILREDSGVVELVRQLEIIIGSRDPRLHALCWECARLADDGVQCWEPTAQEQAQSAAASRLRAALQQAAEELQAARDEALRTLASEIRGCGDTLASEADEQDGHLTNDAVRASAVREREARERFEQAMSAATAPTLTRLAGRMSASAETHMHYQAELRQAAVRATPARERPSDDDLASKVVDTLFTGVEERVAEHVRRISTGGTGSGSPAHDAARKINRLFGVTAKPYVHVHRAEQLQKAIGLGGQAVQLLGPVVDLRSGINDLLRSSRIEERRRDIHDRYAQEAAETEVVERSNTDGYIASALEPFEDAAAPLLESDASLAAGRARATADLGLIRQQAISLADGVSAGWAASMEFVETPPYDSVN